jgi:hypothetical protein
MKIHRMNSSPQEILYTMGKKMLKKLSSLEKGDEDQTRNSHVIHKRVINDQEKKETNVHFKLLINLFYSSANPSSSPRG